MSINLYLDSALFKDDNDQISTALNNGSSLSEACASVGLENNNTSLITQQMQTLMQSSLFERTGVGRLGWNGNITHNGQTQCGVYTVATGGRTTVDIDLDGDGVIQDDEKRMVESPFPVRSIVPGHSLIDIPVHDEVDSGFVPVHRKGVETCIEPPVRIAESRGYRIASGIAGHMKGAGNDIRLIAFVFHNVYIGIHLILLLMFLMLLHLL